MARFVEFKQEHGVVLVNVDQVAYVTVFNSPTGNLIGTSLWFTNGSGKDNDQHRKIVHERYEDVKAKLSK